MTIQWTGPAWLEKPARLIRWPIFDRVTDLHIWESTIDSRFARQLAPFTRLESLVIRCSSSTDMVDEELRRVLGSAVEPEVYVVADIAGTAGIDRPDN